MNPETSHSLDAATLAPQVLCLRTAGPPVAVAISPETRQLAQDLAKSLEKDLLEPLEALQEAVSRLDEATQQATLQDAPMEPAAAAAVASAMGKARMKEAGDVVSAFLAAVGTSWTRPHGALVSRGKALDEKLRQRLRELGKSRIQARTNEEGGSESVSLKAAELPADVQGLDVNVRIALKPSFEIQDKKLVPHKLCSPDPALIQKDIEAGFDVPGVLKSFKPQVTVMSPKNQVS